MNMVCVDWLSRWAQYRPQSVAIIDSDCNTQLTYLEFHKVVATLAQKLAEEYNIARGDRVATIHHNDIGFTFLFFALRRLGAVLVPINFRLAISEWSYLLTNSKPRLLIVGDEFAGLAEQAVAASAGAGLSVSAQKWSKVFAGLLLSEPAIGERFWGVRPDAQPDDPWLILYTSGTTGHPKGAVLTERSITANAMNTLLSLDIRETDCSINFLPFFHTGGWNVLSTPFWFRGATMVLLRKFDPDAVLKLVERHRMSLLFGVPTTLRMMVESQLFSRVDLSSLRALVVGGEPMPLKLIEIWNARNIPVRQGYGLTEFGPNCFSLPAAQAQSKIGSIGFANFFISTRLVDDNDQIITEPNKVGELELKGDARMLEYFENPAATDATIKDAWLKTGDLMRYDDEGFYYVVGRKKEMFISGGENVYPNEIERVIAAHPAVREVAVVGVEDSQWGEVGAAYIVVADVKLTEHELREFTGKRLARFKIPKHWRFVNAIPKSDNGKILKRLLPSIGE